MSPVYRRVPAFNALMAQHCVLTFVMAGLGGVLIAPTNTFGSTPAWRLFVEAGIGEDKIALVLFLIAFVGGVGITPSRAWVRECSIITLAIAHFALAVAFFIGNPAGGAVIPYLGYAALALYAVKREADARS